MNNKLTILIDLDDTIVDFTAHFLKETGLTEFVDPSNISNYLENHTPIGNKVVTLFNIYGFYNDKMPVIKGAIEAIKELQKYHDVYIVTKMCKGGLGIYDEKRAWVKKYLDISYDRFIAVSDKFLIRGDVLIDDKPGHIRKWFNRYLEEELKCSNNIEPNKVIPIGFTFPASWNGNILCETMLTGIELPIHFTNNTKITKDNAWGYIKDYILNLTPEYKSSIKEN